MKNLFTLISIIFLAIGFSQNYKDYEDVIYLKNGSIIHGIIIEQKPNEYDKNHSWRTIKYLSDQHIKTIEKMQKIFKDKGGKRHHFMYYSELFKKCLQKARIRQLES